MIAPGDAAPPLQRTIELPDMVAYAGATWDWHRSHYDTAYAEAMQLPAPMVDGQVYGALFTELLQDWLGPRCFVRELRFGFRTPMFAGETIRCTGTVSEVVEDEHGPQATVNLLGEVVGVDGRPDRVVAAPASAVVLLGRADGPGA